MCLASASASKKFLGLGLTLSGLGLGLSPAGLVNIPERLRRPPWYRDVLPVLSSPAFCARISQACDVDEATAVRQAGYRVGVTTLSNV